VRCRGKTLSRLRALRRWGLAVCVAGCCSVLQCVAVCCSFAVTRWTLIYFERAVRGVVVFCSMLQCVLQCVAVCCSELQCFAVFCSVLQVSKYEVNVEIQTACVAVCCSVLQCVAVCCSVLQCVAVLQYFAVCGGVTVCCSVSRCVAVRCSMSQ